jgi:hypothetical protein
VIRFVMRRAFRSSLRNYGARRFSRSNSWLSLSRYDFEDLADIGYSLPRFDEQQWEDGIEEILEWAFEQAGNPGQETLIKDYLTEPATAYCMEKEEDYIPEEFVNTMKDQLGDTYYYAINEIIDQVAEYLDELRDACHQSLMEGAAGLFGFASGVNAGRLRGIANYQRNAIRSRASFINSMYVPTMGRQYANMNIALQNYQAAAIRNGYKTPDTSANRQFNKEKNRQWLITRFGTGKTQAFGGSRSGLERNPGYAAYQRAAAANGKIIRP